MNFENAIEINGISKKLGDFVLDDISFSLPCGSILGLVGENGAGKSTLIKLILGAMRADCGNIRVLGKDNTERDFTETKNDIGAVLDESYFPEMITAKQVGKIFKNAYRNFDEDKYSSYIEKFSIPENKKFKEYSRGMRMKLGIAAALSHMPRLLLLDEATSGLDPLIRDELLDVFSNFTADEKNSVLISSHIVSDLEKICDYIAFLHNGRLVFFEEKDKLLDEYVLLKLTHENFNDIDSSAVIGSKENSYGVCALVKKSGIPKGFLHEQTTLEDIILFFAKGDEIK